MSLISYSQNFEDVMLYRALKDVRQGFYIDVGAHDPEAGSVTKLFYDMGWHGINIEPIAEPFERLEQARPRDVNLQICAGAEDGEILIHDIRPTGLATTDPDVLKMYQDPQVAQTYLDKDVSITEILSPMRTLTGVCEEYAPEEIHFLKIDVEGAEKEVLRGIDFSRYRPWIVVVEATLPFSQILTHKSWEPVLLDGGYRLAYFDGLNRFYVAQEHRKLLKAFKTPPNYFDHFVSAELVNQREQTALAKSRLAETQGELLAAKDKIAHVRSELDKTIVRAVQAEERLCQEQAALAREQAALAHAQEALAHEQEALAHIQGALAHEQEALAHEQEALAHIQGALTQSEMQRVHAEQTLQGIYYSRSWRITAPLRKAGNLVRGFKLLPQKVVLWNKRMFKRMIAAVVSQIGRNPTLKSKIKLLVRTTPFLNRFALRFIAIATDQSVVRATCRESRSSMVIKALTPLEAKVLRDIQNAIMQRSS